MNKIYKIKSPLRYWIGNAISILALSYVSIGRPGMQIFVGVYLLLLFLYAFSHKVVLDYESREIAEKAYGLIIRKIKVDDIKKYFVKETPEVGILKKNTQNSLISLKLNSLKGEVLKQIVWNITQDDARDLLKEAAKINNSIVSSEEPFYDNLLYKNYKTKYLILILIPLILVFVVAIVYFINKSLESPF